MNFITDFIKPHYDRLKHAYNMERGQIGEEKFDAMIIPTIAGGIAFNVTLLVCAI